MYPEELEDLNIANLMEGLDSRDNAIEPPYSDRYARFKQSIGYSPNKVNLRVTGDFHKSIQARADNTGIEYTASDYKADDLLWKYGEQVLGVSQARFVEFIDNHKEELGILLLK